MHTVRLETMNVATIFKAHTSVGLRLPFFEYRVPAGFPSPADDYHPIKIDLNFDGRWYPATFVEAV